MEINEKYVDLGPVDNSLPTGLEGVNQEQLFAIAGAMLNFHKQKHIEGTQERHAYEAAEGLIDRVDSNPLQRRLGWEKQRRHEEAMKKLENELTQ